MVEEALPVEERTLWGRVESLRGKSSKVSVRDRGLFLERNVPKRTDSKDKMREWVRSVQGSMDRLEETERRTQLVRVFFAREHETG